MVRRADNAERTQLYFTGKPIPSALCEKIRKIDLLGARSCLPPAGPIKNCINAVGFVVNMPIRYIPPVGHTAAIGRRSHLRLSSASQADAPLTPHPTPGSFALSPSPSCLSSQKSREFFYKFSIFQQNLLSVCGKCLCRGRIVLTLEHVCPHMTEPPCSFPLYVKRSIFKNACVFNFDS